MSNINEPKFQKKKSCFVKLKNWIREIPRQMFGVQKAHTQEVIIPHRSITGEFRALGNFDEEHIKVTERGSKLIKETTEVGSNLIKEETEAGSKLIKATEVGSIKATEVGSKLIEATEVGSNIIEATEVGSKLIEATEVGSNTIEATEVESKLIKVKELRSELTDQLSNVQDNHGLVIANEEESTKSFVRQEVALDNHREFAITNGQVSKIDNESTDQRTTFNENGEGLEIDDEKGTDQCGKASGSTRISVQSPSSPATTQSDYSGTRIADQNCYNSKQADISYSVEQQASKSNEQIWNLLEQHEKQCVELDMETMAKQDDADVNVDRGDFKKGPRKRKKPRHYTDIVLEPLVEEVLNPPPSNLKPNIVKGEYSSPEHYLDVQMKLLREDFMSPLRQGIQNIRRATVQDQDIPLESEYVTLYPSCRFVRMEAKKKLGGYQLCFDVERRIQSETLSNSRGLFTGTLLAFSSDHFRTFFFGVVLRTDDDERVKQRVVMVALCHGKQLTLAEFNRSYTMIEPQSLFAPYFYVMRTLQTFSRGDFPFEKYIVGSRQTLASPAYFGKRPSILTGYKKQVTSEGVLSLNPKQYQAYQSALSRELAIIQGPPGTGKTHVGLCIVEDMLKNKSLRKYMNGPVLVVCYTNHALDQFVQGMLKFTQNVLRLGQSKTNPLVKPYNHLEVIETFIAMSKIVRLTLGKHAAFNVSVDKFEQVFEQYKCGHKYKIRVLSFHTEKFEVRCFTPELLKALFYMYTKSMSNQPTSVPKKAILKSCRQYERAIECIGEKLSKLTWMNGIVDVKYLATVMDDESFSRLKMPGALEAWLTEGHCQYIIQQLRKEQSNRGELFNEAKGEGQSDKDDSTDDEVKDFYTVDLRTVKKEIRNTFVELQMYLSNRRHSKKVNQRELELRKKLVQLKEKYELVDRLLYALSHGSIGMQDTQNEIKHIKSDHETLEWRWKVYKSWVDNYRRQLYDEATSLTESYKHVLQELEESIRQPELLDLMQSKDVVAMTTTKAAKIHSVLNALKPRIVVIEEAAEVLETHILASLTKHCEHLVLIGDHKQLGPRVCTHELARDYNLDVSLFERLINNNDLQHVTLEEQYRMRPEICKLLTPFIYDKLLNHTSVLHLPHIRGMVNDIHFFDHKVPEESNPIEKKLWNTFEVEILLILATYLLRQGYSGRDITIIAAYSGQVEKFKDIIGGVPKLSGIRITTIDAYQGEENKIILLSLVRNNAENNVGFLKSANRVCVALSRAKQGLYIMGNMRSLSQQSELWSKLNAELKAQDSIGKGFRLYCKNHKSVRELQTWQDFEMCC